MHASHEQLAGTTQCTMVALLDGAISVVELRAAAQRAQYRSPILGAKIHEQGGFWHFVLDEAHVAPSVTQLARANDETWKAEFITCNSGAMIADEALWRLVLVSNVEDGHARGRSELILQFHHAIMDGDAALALLGALLLDIGERRAATISDMRPFPKAAEAALPERSWQEFSDAQARLMVGGAPTEYPIRPRIGREHRRTETRFIALGSAAMASLRAHSDQQKLALSSYVSALFLRAVAGQLPKTAVHSLFTPFSLRRLYPVASDDDLGCYLCVLPTHHSVSRTHDCDALAREHRAALGRALVLGVRHPSAAPQASFMREAMRATAVMDQTPTRQALGVSLLDRGLQARYGELAVLAMYGAATRSSGQAALAVHGICHRDSMYLTVNYTAGVQDPAWADAVIACFARTMVER
ncbi:MAG: Alcohol acetyltransferase [Pseudomonadota bacterium]